MSGVEIVEAMEGKYWCSKDRFAAKRLNKVAGSLSKEKRAVIEQYSAFRSLLNVSPFNVPNELIDFVGVNTSCELREFNYRGKRIAFNKEMISKVFGVRSGDRPVKLLTKSMQSDLRDAYKGDLARLPIDKAELMLKSHADDDVDSIVRTWDLLCWATVLNPGTNNMMCLEYVGCMDDPKKTDEFDWNEHILELLMEQVKKIQVKKEKPLVHNGRIEGKGKNKLPEVEGGTKKTKKNNKEFTFWISGPMPLLAIVYMDHLDIPKSSHIMNKSCPRACFVTSEDFNFTVSIDRDNKILRNKTIFARRPFLPLSKTVYATAPVTNSTPEDSEINPSASLNEWLVFPSLQDLQIPSRFQALHEKHKVLFASDVDSTLKTLGSGLKSMHSQRMALLLTDVDAALREGAGPSVVFPTGTSRDDESNIGKTPDASESEEDDEGEETEADIVVGDATIPDVEPFVAKDGEGHVGAAGVGNVLDVQGFESKEGEEQVGTAVVADLHGLTEGNTSNNLDVPQPAVFIDPSRTVGDDGDHDDVSSPVRTEMAAPTCQERVIPAGYWDDIPKFDLWSQGSELDRIVREPEQATDSSMLCAVKGTAAAEVCCAEKVAATALAHKGEASGGETSDDIPSATTPDEIPTAATPDDIPSAATPDARVSPVHPTAVGEDTDVVLGEKDASTGIHTFQRRTRNKRARKDVAAPPAPKRLKKLSKDVLSSYDKYVQNGRTLKPIDTTKKRKDPANAFIQIGRFYCDYRSFRNSLAPRKYLDSQVMGVWAEDFNKASKKASDKSSIALKKYVFSCYMSMKLIVPPEEFDPEELIKEFRSQNVAFRIMKNNLLHFPVVQDHHWMVCTVNLLHDQFHIFDSMLNSKGRSNLEEYGLNLFKNFSTLCQASKVFHIDLSKYTLVSIDHPQQNTLYDCGFFAMLFMENFTSRFMMEFPNDSIPNYRKLVAARLIESNEKPDLLEKAMDSALQD